MALAQRFEVPRFTNCLDGLDALVETVDNLLKIMNALMVQIKTAPGMRAEEAKAHVGILELAQGAGLGVDVVAAFSTRGAVVQACCGFRSQLRRATDSSLRDRVIREGLRLGQSVVHLHVRFSVGSGIGFGSSAGTEEWKNLARRRRRSHMPTFARQGSTTRNVDQQGNGLNRRHGGDRSQYPERSCMRKGTNNGGAAVRTQWGVIQQRVNNGITHCFQWKGNRTTGAEEV